VPELVYVFLQNYFHCSSPISCLANLFNQSSIAIEPACSGENLEARGEGEQSNVARLLDGQAKTTLMPCAYTGQATRNDLSPLCDEALQQTNIAVRDSIDLFGAELADLLAPEKLTATRAAAGSASGSWATGSTRAGAGMAGRVTGVAAAWAGCMCVLLGGVRAGFVSHDISLSDTLCLPPLQARVGVSEHSTSGRVEAEFGDRDAVCDEVRANIANA
jgi:hypothetical protein